MTVASMIDRMIRAAKLDIHLYEEVEADKGALGQAMGVVVLASIAGGFGSGSQGGFNILPFVPGFFDYGHELLHQAVAFFFQ